VASLDRTAMIVRVLEATGIVAAGQSANTADTTLVGELVDSAHSRLRKLGLAPFSLGAVPEWAQVPFRDYVAFDAAGSYGVGGERLADLAQRRQLAERDLGRQTSGYRHNLPIKGSYF
jgi:hypothetical protein